ncbi:MAG: hypothetical protein H6668_00040 [Ardenticatenaceae bacterium]|nr:hypothetical protein [Ardenticatenaceae bacterium]
MKWGLFWVVLLAGLVLVGCDGAEGGEETAVFSTAQSAAETAVDPTESAKSGVDAEVETGAETGVDPTTVAPTNTPLTESGIITELEITSWQRVEAEGERLGETVDCFERLFANGRFVLFDNGNLTYTPGDAAAISDCLLLDASELTGNYEPSDEADYAFEIDDIKQFAGLDDIEIDADGTMTESADGAEGTLRIRVFPSSGSDRTRIQIVQGNYLFNGATAVATVPTAVATVPAEEAILGYTLADPLALINAPQLVPVPDNTGEALNILAATFVTEQAVADINAYYYHLLSGRGWSEIVADENKLQFRQDPYSLRLQFEEVEGTIVDLQVTSNDEWIDLKQVPLPEDAQIGALTFKQTYESLFDGTDVNVDRMIPLFEEKSWVLIEEESTSSGRVSTWQQADQEVVLQVQSRWVELTYSFGYPLIAVNLDLLRAGTAVAPSALEPINPADYSGDFSIAGSDNMVIVDELMVQFLDAGFTGFPVLNLSNNTAAGIASLCNGLADGVLSSRAITEEELVLCSGNGAQVLDFTIAYTLNQPIILITLDTTLQAKPQVAAFMNYVLTNGRLALLNLDLDLPDAATQQRNDTLWLNAVDQ